MMNLPWLAHYESLGIITPGFEDKPFGSFIEEHARIRPEAIAMWYITRGISYLEYNEQANRLANALVKLGVNKGDVVGIHLPNIPQYPITLAAISKIGAIGSGISPLLAPPEVAYQIQDAGIKVIITLSELSLVLSAMPKTPDCLEYAVVTAATDLLAPTNFDLPKIKDCEVLSYLSHTQSASDEYIQTDVHWNDTFMIQYTGGTTGKPKGAMLSQRNVMHNTAQSSAVNPFDAGQETLLSAFPMFHIAGLANAIASAIYGGKMILVPNPRDTDFICAQLKKNPPNVMIGVPALYDMMVANPAFADIDFSQLRVAVSGAAPLTSGSYDALSAIIGEKKISDAFGMTETAPCYTVNPPKQYKLGSIGFPVPNAKVRIRDVETGNHDMPFGEPGEIVCTGPQVMKGYLNLPNESAKALREIDGERWMFSGDVGYMDEDGYIFLCDRAKDMLIVGGYKVFSVEVEDKLSAIPEIGACAVIGTEDKGRPGNDIVNLYVELSAHYKDADQNTTKNKILTFCRESMAAFKAPKHIHFIDAIPLTAVGKIDKKALR
ncbi:MAG: long-chain acyl-CoA synthetase [Paraglaciecola sp.]|jgi:long-chain acyl-CoA synthetase